MSTGRQVKYAVSLCVMRVLTRPASLLNFGRLGQAYHRPVETRMTHSFFWFCLPHLDWRFLCCISSQAGCRGDDVDITGLWRPALRSASRDSGGSTARGLAAVRSRVHIDAGGWTDPRDPHEETREGTNVATQLQRRSPGHCTSIVTAIDKSVSSSQLHKPAPNNADATRAAGARRHHRGMRCNDGTCSDVLLSLRFLCTLAVRCPQGVTQPELSPSRAAVRIRPPSATAICTLTSAGAQGSRNRRDEPDVQLHHCNSFSCGGAVFRMGDARAAYMWRGTACQMNRFREPPCRHCSAARNLRTANNYCISAC